MSATSRSSFRSRRIGRCPLSVKDDLLSREYGYLIIAADSRTIHSEYVGKTTGPATMLAANCLRDIYRLAQKRHDKPEGYLMPKFWAIPKNVSHG
jgi:hypothetical protein